MIQKDDSEGGILKFKRWCRDRECHIPFADITDKISLIFYTYNGRSVLRLVIEI
jgi:hypothetical protein